jgi:hypothetical protein
MEGGIRWLLVEVEVWENGRRFRTVGPWITEREWQQVAEWLAAAPDGETENCIELIEPNIRFGFDEESQTLSVYLDQECRPPWLVGIAIKFWCPAGVRRNASEDMHRELALIGH